jgi:hypothetical protein
MITTSPLATARDVRLFVAWTMTLDYRSIRAAETLQAAQFVKTGRRVRAVMVTADVCIARDGQFYQIIDGIAHHLSPADVLRMYPLDTLQEMVRRALTHRNTH